MGIELPENYSSRLPAVKQRGGSQAASSRDKTFFIMSLAAHAALIAYFIFGLELISTRYVFENTNKTDVISAVVLGDTEKSKIVTEQSMPTPPPIEPAPVKEAEAEPVKAKPKPVEEKKEVIALKPVKKILPVKPNFFAKDLLADIKKINDQKKKIKQSQLKKQFEKTLRKQAELSLRQQLLNEDIKLKGTQARYSSGVVNKYTALILQAIGEHWMVPAGAKKTLTTRLLIRLAPDGQVLDVQVTHSSGDPSLDRSAHAAVMKASPLPVPSKPDDFEPFRQFELNAKPENVVASDGAPPA